MISYEALALTGVVQAAGFVHAIAHGRTVDIVARRATLAAVMTHRAQDLAEVFPAPEAFQLGMQTLHTALSGTAIIDVAVAEPTTGDLAEVYRQTIGKLDKPIQVAGDPDLLREESIANSIRAQLLAGIRFAWLWRQLGGRRWHLILRRRSLLVALQSLMSRD